MFSSDLGQLFRAAGQLPKAHDIPVVLHPAIERFTQSCEADDPTGIQKVLCIGHNTNPATNGPGECFFKTDVGSPNSNA